MHPLFINCLLEKIRRMEERVTEIVSNRDVMEADNLKLKEKVDLSDKHLVRLKNHKNKLIRRVLKLQVRMIRMKRSFGSLMLKLHLCSLGGNHRVSRVV